MKSFNWKKRREKQKKKTRQDSSPDNCPHTTGLENAVLKQFCDLVSSVDRNRVFFEAHKTSYTRRNFWSVSELGPSFDLLFMEFQLAIFFYSSCLHFYIFWVSCWCFFMHKKPPLPLPLPPLSLPPVADLEKMFLSSLDLLGVQKCRKSPEAQSAFRRSDSIHVLLERNLFILLFVQWQSSAGTFRSRLSSIGFHQLHPKAIISDLLDFLHTKINVEIPRTGGQPNSQLKNDVCHWGDALDAASRLRKIIQLIWNVCD